MALLDWPGKSAPSSDSPEHSAMHHMLDVAAVAEILIERFDFDGPVKDALVLLVALHDLGKISESFRQMLREDVRQSYRHWELTEVLLFDLDEALAERLGGQSWHRQQLYSAAAGHHGRPSKLDLGGLCVAGKRPRDYRLAMASVGIARDDAVEAVRTLLGMWPDASLRGISDDQATALSWWLPGFCTAADWIGSNTSWFPPKEANPELFCYLGQARDAAKVAVAEAGLGSATISDERLFDFNLRPMQAACCDVALPAGPMLVVIEDETGAGKTEAAFMLAQRMLVAGKGSGLFVALPTMATADAMFRRAIKVVGKLFGLGVSMTLAHGRSGLSIEFRDLVSTFAKSEDDVTCSEWLAESRRRTLLSTVGVGTIDQALLSVLPVKFQALRHFGLSSKILVVDEVHELGEPYIGAELEALLRMHRAAGGSAILLTATLPLGQRARLLSVYGGHSDSRAYPALTVAGGVARSDFPQATGLRGIVKVERLAMPGEAVDLLAGRAAEGAACVWVRNAVDDAISAVEALRAKGISAHLLHARFALCDRKRIETEVHACVGKEGNGRAGFVLVGTQVLESSLDFDFDVMVSDLAPMAALIQRAGRLWRHMDLRPVASRPVLAPVLSVVSPDPAEVADDRWLHGTLDRGAWVYPVADQWRTAQILFAAGQIEAPSGLRTLIEAVHGADAEALPEGLRASEMIAEGKGAAQRGHAAQNIVNWAAGYRMGGQAYEDASYPTRLGEPQRTLVLARREFGRLRPWADGLASEAWSLSEVSARRGRLDSLPLPDQALPEIAAVTCDWPEWKRIDYRLCPVAQDGSICSGLHYDALRGLVFSSSK